MTPNTSPPGRTWSAACWDATRNAVVLFGGENGAPLNDVWEWTGSNWTNIPPTGPTPRHAASLVYDPVRQHSILFGGHQSGVDLSDLWLYGNRTAAAGFERFGIGCGTAFVPTLDVTTANGQAHHPFLGAVFGLTLSNLPPNAPAGLDLGLSRTSYAGLSLPLDLSIWQMSGCFLYQDRTVTFGLATNASGVAMFTIQVPNTRHLVGATFFQQGFAGDPTANPLGIVVSNGTAATIGAR